MVRKSDLNFANWQILYSSNMAWNCVLPVGGHFLNVFGMYGHLQIAFKNFVSKWVFIFFIL